MLIAGGRAELAMRMDGMGSLLYFCPESVTKVWEMLVQWQLLSLKFTAFTKFIMQFLHRRKKKYLDVDYCAEVDTSTLQFYISHVLLNVLPFPIPISLFLSPAVLHFTESNFLSNTQSLESCLSTTSGSNKLFHRGLTIAKHISTNCPREGKTH